MVHSRFSNTCYELSSDISMDQKTFGIILLGKRYPISVRVKPRLRKVITEKEDIIPSPTDSFGISTRCTTAAFFFVQGRTQCNNFTTHSSVIMSLFG